MEATALRVAASTNGLVDPTLGEAIEAAGYDRDFAELRPNPEPARGGSPGRWRTVRVGRGWLSRPPALKLDLNGVVKGRTVDDALRRISGHGFVSAGGDIATRRPVASSFPVAEPSGSFAAASPRAERPSASGSARARGSTICSTFGREASRTRPGRR
jgi:hypothetical protein